MDCESIDSLITDPPAGISFMNKAWDKSDGFISEMTEIFKECLRVMKPGAHGLVWAIPRTSHWTATALEDAGFEIRDVVTHIFGTGFPKSLDISKAIDKAAGAEREVVGKSTRHGGGINNNYAQDEWTKQNASTMGMTITAPSTPEAKQWSGYGTSLKPACEFWWLIRKPCSESTVAKNVLKWGCGGLNIDASRIGVTDGVKLGRNNKEGSNGWKNSSGGDNTNALREKQGLAQLGRFPSNLLFSHNPDCVEVGIKKVKSHNPDNKSLDNTTKDIYGKYPERSLVGHASIDGTETVAAWECSEGCAVAMLDAQSGNRPSRGAYKDKKQIDTGNTSMFGFGGLGQKDKNTYANEQGGASRFFYCSKASKRDKGADNTHPTVKSTKLMEYLITLITPPDGIVLDPFMGSGSTGVAAKRLGFNFIGIEREPEYMDIAKCRLTQVE